MGTSRSRACVARYSPTRAFQHSRATVARRATARAVMSEVIQGAHAISVPAPMATRDPFLFCVYHKDLYPAGDAKMQAPRRGNGADFDAKQPYRMYHGDKIPGFPQHPHRGFETITAVMKGTIDR